MDLGYSPEQRQLRATVRAYLAAQHRSDQPRAVWGDFAGKLGILGAALPLEVGGSGGGAVETMIIMEELGAALVSEPFLDAAVIAGFLFSAAGGREAELAQIASGVTRHALAWLEPQARYAHRPVGTRAVRDGAGWRLSGAKLVVEDAARADRLIVTACTHDGGAGDGVSLLLVDPALPGVTITGYRTVDGRWAADVGFSDVALGPDALLGRAHEALALVEHASDLAATALGGEALGVLRAMLDQTIAYTAQRRQFGQPIATFQALQHRMVDMFLALERARSAVCLATLNLDEPAPARARAVSAAKVLVGEACRFVGENAIQLHGGMGMAEDAPISRYFRRAMVIEGAFGTRDHHLARFAALTRGS